jgi:hypothetical protein
MGKGKEKVSAVPTRAYVAPDVLLSLLCSEKQSVQVLRVMRERGVEPVTSLFALYEACACIDPGDKVTSDSVRMVMEGIGFTHVAEECEFMRLPLSDERRAHLRKVAKVDKVKKA